MATRSATAWFQLKLRSTIANTLDTGQLASIQAINALLTTTFANGVEANQANRAMALLDYPITPGSTWDLDVYDWAGVDIGCGAGKDLLGQDAVFEEVVALIIRHASGTGSLEIFSSVPERHLEWCPHLTVANGSAMRAGSVFCIFQPAEAALDVQDDWSHRIRFSAVGGYVYFDLFLLGRHDDEASSSSLSTTSSTLTSQSTSTLTTTTTTESS